MTQRTVSCLLLFILLSSFVHNENTFLLYLKIIRRKAGVKDMAICSFERIEKKFMMDQAQYEAFINAVAEELAVDEYGLHTICNIYFDTDHNDLISRSIEKPVYKEKFRLRSYGVPKDDSTVFLEIKKKYDGIVYKRRVQMSLKDAKRYLSTGIRPDKMAHQQIMKEIDYFVQYYKPQPKQFIAYDRIAMYGVHDDQLRLTIDQNIRERREDLFLEHGSYGRRILPENTYLMEIKVPGAMPLWLARILSELKIRPVSFSKYGVAYKQWMFQMRQPQELKKAQ